MSGTQNSVSLLKLDKVPRKRVVKANWTDDHHRFFVDVCVKEVMKQNRPTTYLNNEGYINLMNAFRKKFGVEWDRKCFKNKWENLRKDWTTWCRLLKDSSGHEWDNEKNTIIASNDWWESHLQVNPNAAKFRFAGLKFAKEYEIMFGDTLTTGACAPTGVIPEALAQLSQNQESSEPDPNSQTEQDQTEESAEHVPNSQMEEEQTENPIGLGEGNHELEPPTQCGGAIGGANLGVKRRKVSALQKISTNIGRISDAMEAVKRSCIALSSYPTIAAEISGRIPTIVECKALLDQIPQVPKNSDIYLFALDKFINRDIRDLWMTMDDSEMRLAWLSRQYHRESAKHLVQINHLI
ncbi:PREDICTED: L10-interacting MYB domain-containing protein-like [Nelumbo nucifera]|uniref:L10-interacting MYB domain-containing protein-like n=1 Tax=Nelumbo nucifera TaxID=4432 RepID=A0A1U8B326_NELNU|nr:PREDICTED: L10-interacting MYB domain-containing protein-like [Nelumbo nucifera]